MKHATVLLFILAALMIGGILLQIFLSKRESRWFGLILPGITFLYALLMVLGVAIYDGMSTGEAFMLASSTFLIGNIPTFVLLGVYFGCREKRKIRQQLDKMNIQDLE